MLSTISVSRSQSAPAAGAKDDPIVLERFDVTAGSNKGYMATNTTSGTAMNTPLKEVPMAINLITAEFLADSLDGNPSRPEPPQDPVSFQQIQQPQRAL